jgi:hypothetical protein
MQSCRLPNSRVTEKGGIACTREHGHFPVTATYPLCSLCCSVPGRLACIGRLPYNPKFSGPHSILFFSAGGILDHCSKLMPRCSIPTRLPPFQSLHWDEELGLLRRIRPATKNQACYEKSGLLRVRVFLVQYRRGCRRFAAVSESPLGRKIRPATSPRRPS